MKSILVSISLLLIPFSPLLVRSEPTPDPRAGYTCKQILKLQTDKWADIYGKKIQDGSEVSQDMAHEAYAECHKLRNDLALAKLPQSAARRIENYRTYFQKFRIAAAMLDMAYAGGGTMYVHAARRNSVVDEELVEKMIRMQQSKGLPSAIKIDPKSNSSVKIKLAQLRTQLSSRNPVSPKNRQQLAEYNAQSDAREQYNVMLQNFEAIAKLLPTESPNLSNLMLKSISAFKSNY
jgi:hypothetical protein